MITSPGFLDYLGTVFAKLNRSNTFDGSLYRTSGGTKNLGSASVPWDIVYADTVTANTIIGQMSGAEWENSDDMYIDAHHSSKHTVVYVVNQDSTYEASLNVERNIIVGGTVDGVDLGNFNAAQFLVLTASGYMSNERVISAGDGISGTDGGAGGSYTLAVDYGTGLGIYGGQLIHGTGDIGDVHTNYTEHDQNETITGDWSFSTRIGVGTGVSAAAGIYNRQEVSATTGTYYGLFVWDTLQPTADYDTSYYATRSRIDVATNFDHTASLIGAVYADARCSDGYTGDINSILGLYVLVDTEDAASTTIARGMRVDTPYVDTGLIVTGYGIHVQQGTVGTGSITTLYGIKIDSITAGGTNYSIYTGSGDVSLGGQTLEFRLEGHIETSTGDAILIQPSGGDIQLGQSSLVSTGIIFIDKSQNGVGINCAPDPQFALDIYGNMRTQGYIVGKHAIQISDALMICHYDGQEPFVWDWTGTPIGHLGQSPVLDLTHYEAGKFQKGVVVGRNTTNLTRDPIFGYGDTSRWASSGSGTLTRTAEKVKYGTASGKLTLTADSSWVAIYDNNGTAGDDDWYSPSPNSTLAGQTVTVSGWAYQPSGQPQARFIAFDGTDAWDTIGSSYFPAVYDQWVYHHYTFTIRAGSTRHWVRVQLNGDTGEYCYVDGLQFEIVSYPTALCCGAFQDCTWSGTEHASTSSRVAGKLAYNIQDIDLRAVDESCGTVLIWAFSNDWDRMGANSRYCWRFNEGSDYAFVGNTDVETFRFTWRGGGSVGNYDSYNAYSYLTDYSWHLFGMTWDFRGTTARVEFSVDGVSVAVYTNASPFEVQPDDYIYVGNYNSLYQWNEPIDDLVIAGYPMDIDEILAIYESDAPVFAETSVFHFSAGGSLVWADTEGLWARTIDGDASLGWSGVDSKSWGGHTLDQGDFLLGNTSAGWVKWDANPDGNPELIIGMGASSNKVISLPSSGNAKIAGTLEVDGYVKAGYANTAYRLTLDANGLWGTEDDGSPSIGWSAKDAQSWGGKTLASGDFLLGNTDGAWLYWDADYGTSGRLIIGQTSSDIMRFPTSGNAEIVGTLEVTGTITAGGGAVFLDSNGLGFNTGEGSQHQLTWYDTTPEERGRLAAYLIDTYDAYGLWRVITGSTQSFIAIRAGSVDEYIDLAVSSERIGLLTDSYVQFQKPTRVTSGGLRVGVNAGLPSGYDIEYEGYIRPYRGSSYYDAYVPVNFYHNSVSSAVTIGTDWTNIFSITSANLGSPPSGKISVRGSITIQVTSFSTAQDIILRILTNGSERQRQYLNVDRAWETQQIPINWTGDYTSGGTVTIAAQKADSNNTIQAMATYSHIDVINYT